MGQSLGWLGVLEEERDCCMNDFIRVRKARFSYSARVTKLVPELKSLLNSNKVIHTDKACEFQKG